jgi:hypothetical protein
MDKPAMSDEDWEIFRANHAKAVPPRDPPPPAGEGDYGFSGPPRGAATESRTEETPKPRFRTLREFCAEYQPLAEVIAGVLISGSPIRCSRDKALSSRRIGVSPLKGEPDTRQTPDTGSDTGTIAGCFTGIVQRAKRPQPAGGHCRVQSRFSSAARLQGSACPRALDIVDRRNQNLCMAEVSELSRVSRRRRPKPLRELDQTARRTRLQLEAEIYREPLVPMLLRLPPDQLQRVEDERRVAPTEAFRVGVR